MIDSVKTPKNGVVHQPDFLATQPAKIRPLRIAYTIQNVGLDLSKQVGDVVPVRYTLEGLQKAGHTVRVFELQGRDVAQIDDVRHLDDKSPTALGMSGKRPFQLTESVIRRVQGMANLPYYAFFDSRRFYEACLNSFPDYTLCHEHNGLFSPASAMACKRLKMPYVLTFSADPIFESELVGRPLTGLHLRVANKEARFTYEQADQILCVSNPAKKHLVDVWQVDPDKINVMPNGVDIRLFAGEYDTQAARAEWGLGDDPVISFVGGFQPWHGLDNLVESFATILQDVPNAKLMLVGDGPFRPELEQKIAECNVGASTIITGLLPQERMPELLSVADIAVIPYPKLPKELWFSPLKLYEYMAAGKAIVSSAAGQIAEVLENGRNGLLVESGNIPEFTQAVLSLLKDPAKRNQLGAIARQQAITQHSWEQYIRKLENIYLKTLSNERKK
ncbi:MAG: glycosyltransferase family 4 protein [Chloroflexi bacterium]|nr:glycosyltransferase family 4 protein [Chloroflexota bacterium]